MPDHYDHIARLQIELEGTDPLVWRRVDVPLDHRLRRVHQVIQAVFDWNGSHLHQFEVSGRLYGLPEVMGKELAGVQLRSDRNVKLGGRVGSRLRQLRLHLRFWRRLGPPDCR